MDFIGPLPLDQGHDCILTIMDCLSSDVCIIPISTKLAAKDLASLFFDNWYCENGLPSNIISDHDKLFMSLYHTIWYQMQSIHKLPSSIQQR